MRALCLAAVLLSACSDDPQPQLIDASTVDAPYDMARCLITGHYGALGTKTGTVGDVQGSPTLTISLDPGPPRDTFFLKLNVGKGVFIGGLANGTHTLAGADLDFNNCGLCVNIIADIVSGVGPTKFYFADAGMVTLTSTSPPAGHLTNVSFREVTASGQVVSNGCTATITTMSFSM